MKKKKIHHLFSSVNLNYFIFFWIKWATRFYNSWASTEASSVLRGIVSSTFAFGGRGNIEINRSNMCFLHQVVPYINFLPTRYTAILTFYLKPLNSSCMHRQRQVQFLIHFWLPVFAIVMISSYLQHQRSKFYLTPF